MINREITYSWGPSGKATRWPERRKTIGWLLEYLMEHHPGRKDGPAIVMGDIVQNSLGKRQRLQKAMRSMSLLAIDLDNGTSFEQVDAALRSFGRLAVLYSTHSHMNSTSLISEKDFNNVSDESDVDPLATCLRYLREEKNYGDDILANATYGGASHQTSDGFFHVVNHQPVPKWRLFFFLDRDFVFADQRSALEITHDEALEIWASKVRGVGAKLSLTYDTACVTADRLMYLPRHKAGAPFESHLYKGGLLNLDEIEGVASAKSKRFGGKDGNVPASEYTFTPSGIDLRGWFTRNAERFELAEVIRARAGEGIYDDKGDKVVMPCPFQNSHTLANDPNDRAFFVANASEAPEHAKTGQRSFVASCRHDSCQKRLKTDFVCKMIMDDTIPEDVLADADYIDAVEDENGSSSEDFDETALLNLLCQVNTLTLDTPDTAIDALLERAGEIGVWEKRAKRLHVEFMP